MKSLILATMSLILLSCDSHVDDQTIATPEQEKFVNPAVTHRDFLKINAKHKVLLAVMDSGIDYNHPLLKNNLHFTLDKEGLPVAFGWDYTGNDPWPAPYVARTNFFNPNLSDEDRQESLKMLMGLKALHQEYPDLAEYFPLERSVDEEEIEGVSHGTHVAGLATYDSPEIGLVGYRVMPLNIPSRQEGINEVKASTKFGVTLLDGINKAIQDGASVINMSLGITAETSESIAKKNFFEAFKKSLLEVVTSNPEVLFIVASGNDGKWIDGTAVSVLPCFIPRKNVICVSALGLDMVPADFSNIVKNDEITTIFAWGEDVLSTVPQGICSSEKLQYENILNGPEGRATFAGIARVECAKESLLKEMSGTSMASPIIARKAAKLKAKFPELSALQIKDKIFEEAVVSSLDGMKVWKLPVEKPSWYPTTKGRNVRRAFFPDFYFPKK